MGWINTHITAEKVWSRNERKKKNKTMFSLLRTWIRQIDSKARTEESRNHSALSRISQDGGLRLQDGLVPGGPVGLDRLGAAVLLQAVVETRSMPNSL